MKKPFAFLLTGLTASLAAHAAAYAPADTNPFQINIPNLQPGFEFTAEGLYLKPTNNDLDYANVYNNNSYDVKAVKPKYHFGYHLGIGYVFPNSGNDVRLSWTHVNESDTNSVTAGNNQIITPIYNANPDALPFTSGLGKVDTKYDAIDLDAGQFVNMGTHLQMRFFGGLHYAHIKSNLTTDLRSSTAVGTEPAASLVTNPSKFNGIGPRFGVDTAYNIGNGFGVAGHFAAALLVGQVKAEKSLTLTSASGTSINTSTPTSKVSRVVPNLDAKLGLAYSRNFSNISAVTLEAGYQISHYFNAIDRFNYNGVSDTNLDIDSVTRSTSGIGFNGPYLSLNVKV